MVIISGVPIFRIFTVMYARTQVRDGDLFHDAAFLISVGVFMMHQVATAGIYPFSLRQKNPQKCSLSWALNNVKMILFHEVQNWTI